MFPETVLIAAIHIAHVFEISKGINGDVKLLGIEGRYMDILLKALGARYDVVLPPDNEEGRLTRNGSWTGMMQLLFSGKVDLAISSLSITEQRKEIVQFSDPYTIEDATFIVERKGPLPQAMAFLYPFSGTLWICIVLIIIIIPIPFIFLSGIRYSYMKLFLQMLGYVLRQPLTIDLSSIRSKILLAVWSVFSILISICYSALLLSFLSVPLAREQIRTFNELSKAVNKGVFKAYSICGSSHVEALKTSQDINLKSLGETIAKNNWFFCKWDSHVDKHFTNDVAIIGHRSFLRLFFQKGNYQQTLISEDKIISCKIAIAMRNDFCCKQQLNKMISRMKNAGIYEKLIREEMLRKQLLHVTVENDEIDTEVLSIEDISGCLMLLSCGYFMSLTVLFGEITVHYVSNYFQEKKN